MTLSVKNNTEEKSENKKVIFTQIYKRTPPTRLTFRALHKMYKELYDEGKLIENGAAHRRMQIFESKITPLKGE
mgnify:FL=1